jgi:hypothetical protein
MNWENKTKKTTATIESGFEHVTEMESIKILRKRK